MEFNKCGMHLRNDKFDLSVKVLGVDLRKFVTSHQKPENT